MQHAEVSQCSYCQWTQSFLTGPQEQVILNAEEVSRPGKRKPRPGLKDRCRRRRQREVAAATRTEQNDAATGSLQTSRLDLDDVEALSDTLLGKFLVKAATNKALVVCLSQDLAMQQSKFAERLKALEGENAKLKHSTYEMQQENHSLQIEIRALHAGTFHHGPEWTNSKLTIQREISRELWSDNRVKELELDRLRKMDILRKLQEEEKRQLENKCRDMDCRLRAAESSLEELRQEIADLDVVELYRAWSPNDDLKEQHRRLEQKYGELQAKMRVQDRVLQGKDLKLKELEEKQSFVVLSNWLDHNTKHDLVGVVASPHFQQSRFFSDDWCVHMHRRLRNRKEVGIPQPQWRPSFHLFPSLGRLLQRLPVR
mmetsp:Transcript_5992/g.9755  ORF Transcript_5992/g.9755 Transcript_5992/m.9755 type:complete len:371 (-) Transcript_5992:134-1246(-)